MGSKLSGNSLLFLLALNHFLFRQACKDQIRIVTLLLMQFIFAVYGGTVTSMRSIQIVMLRTCAGNYVPHQIGLSRGVLRNIHPARVAKGIVLVFSRAVVNSFAL